MPEGALRGLHLPGQQGDREGAFSVSSQTHTVTFTHAGHVVGDVISSTTVLVVIVFARGQSSP